MWRATFVGVFELQLLPLAGNEDAFVIAPSQAIRHSLLAQKCTYRHDFGMLHFGHSEMARHCKTLRWHRHRADRRHDVRASGLSLPIVERANGTLEVR